MDIFEAAKTTAGIISAVAFIAWFWVGTTVMFMRAWWDDQSKWWYAAAAGNAVVGVFLASLVITAVSS